MYGGGIAASKECTVLWKSVGLLPIRESGQRHNTSIVRRLMKQVTAPLYGDTEGLFPLTHLSFGATCHAGGMEMGGKFPIIEEVHDKPGPECIQGFHIQRFIPDVMQSE